MKCLLGTGQVQVQVLAVHLLNETLASVAVAPAASA